MVFGLAPDLNLPVTSHARLRRAASVHNIDRLVTLDLSAVPQIALAVREQLRFGRDEDAIRRLLDAAHADSIRQLKRGRVWSIPSGSTRYSHRWCTTLTGGTRRQSETGSPWTRGPASPAAEAVFSRIEHCIPWCHSRNQTPPVTISAKASCTTRGSTEQLAGMRHGRDCSMPGTGAEWMT